MAAASPASSPATPISIPYFLTPEARQAGTSPFANFLQQIEHAERCANQKSDRSYELIASKLESEIPNRFNDRTTFIEHQIFVALLYFSMAGHCYPTMDNVKQLIIDRACEALCNAELSFAQLYGSLITEALLQKLSVVYKKYSEVALPPKIRARALTTSEQCLDPSKPRSTASVAREESSFQEPLTEVFQRLNNFRKQLIACKRDAAHVQLREAHAIVLQIKTLDKLPDSKADQVNYLLQFFIPFAVARGLIVSDPQDQPGLINPARNFTDDIHSSLCALEPQLATTWQWLKLLFMHDPTFCLDAEKRIAECGKALKSSPS